MEHVEVGNIIWKTDLYHDDSVQPSSLPRELEEVGVSEAYCYFPS